jgi:hypothetical protein
MDKLLIGYRDCHRRRHGSQTMNTHFVRFAGPIIGAACGVTAFVTVNGLWGYVAGGVVFFGCAAISEWIWRRKATPEDIRQDLESRARDTLG